MGLFRFSKVSQVPGVDCQSLISLGGFPCDWNGTIRGVGLLGLNGAIGGVGLFGLNPGFLLWSRIDIMGLLLSWIGIMGKVGMGGVGSSTMD